MLERIQGALQLQDLSLMAVLDILLLAVIIYQLLLLIRGTRSVNMMLALTAIVALHLLTGLDAVRLDAVHTVLGTMLGYIPIAVIVLFQSQIRRALSRLGRNPFTTFMPKRADETLIQEVALASASMASKRLGALIVIERGVGLRTFYETGIALDAEVSYDLLMNIFTFRSPLHDGAVIIAEGRLKAASCYLPLTMNPSLSRTYGTRHRAAFGITEESDALAVVVSEERGVVSLIVGAEIKENLDARSLERELAVALGLRREQADDAAAAAAAGRDAVAAGSSDA